ncbi:MAG: Crp/Fnr family transcriptional regulator [Deltaproteobacteria bacterium]|nr:Crp/Fnr family transcriptional regulator [Deltaproteobacteria bacterium]
MYKQKCMECPSRQDSFFCSMAPTAIQKLDQLKIPQKYSCRDVLFQQGDQAKGLYCIQTGKVKLYKSDTQGHQKIVHIAGPGEMIGYRSMIAEVPFEASAECIENSTMCFIHKKDFEQLLKNDVEFLMKVTRSLAKSLGQAQTNELNLAHKHIDQRFADLLVYLSNRFGKNCSEGIKIDLNLSRQEIADFIGSTQESAIRIMSTFKKIGIIQVDKKCITIIDHNKLVEMVASI